MAENFLIPLKTNLSIMCLEFFSDVSISLMKAIARGMQNINKDHLIRDFGPDLNM